MIATRNQGRKLTRSARAHWANVELTAYIGLGSNLGPREETLRQALQDLAGRSGVSVTQVSCFTETEPVGGPPQGPFINAAAELRTTLKQLLADLAG